MDPEQLYEFFFDNLHVLFYPEIWLDPVPRFSKSELFSLLLVDRHEQVMMGQVAESINLSLSTTTGIVERLVRGGYLKRARDEADRRIVVVTLTKRGQKVVSSVKEKLYARIEVLFESALSEEERALFLNSLLKLVREFRLADSRVRSVKKR